jgi:aryl-alcohol dehydrogenase-like predicted oxidoreductase
LFRALGQTEIVCVQNLFNLADQRSFDLLRDCMAESIAFVPFFPLGWPRGAQNAVLTSPVLTELSARLSATPAQIALAWLLELAPDVLLIPGTRTREHLAENIGSGFIHLDDGAREVLERNFPIISST